jgi:hypothetical protein
VRWFVWNRAWGAPPTLRIGTALSIGASVDSLLVQACPRTASSARGSFRGMSRRLLLRNARIYVTFPTIETPAGGASKNTLLNKKLRQFLSRVVRISTFDGRGPKLKCANYNCSVPPANVTSLTRTASFRRIVLKAWR